MRYQLVIQFAADTIPDYDALIAMEHQLTDTLGDGFVDGHDMSCGEANIFILTSDPRDTLRSTDSTFSAHGAPKLVEAICSCGQRLATNSPYLLQPVNLPALQRGKLWVKCASSVVRNNSRKDSTDSGVTS
jgi:hypothetical protein